MNNRASMKFALLLTLVASAIGLQVYAASISTTPSGPAPEGRIGIPLNESSAPQIKSGSLQIYGTTTVSGDLVLGRNLGISRICFFPSGVSDCRKSWDEALGFSGYLHLNTNLNFHDTGYAILTGSDLANAPAATITATAGTPDNSFPSYGLKTITKDPAADTTAVGVAVAGFATGDDTHHFGIYATTIPGSDYSLNAWAGLFTGSVAVSNQAGKYDPAGSVLEQKPQGDLLIGNTTADAGNKKAEICLFNVNPLLRCRDSWPVFTGNGYWAFNALPYLSPGSQTVSVSAGGSGATAPFRVAVTSVGVNPVAASLKVSGVQKYEKYVVGIPTDLNPGDACGDGICNNGENDIFGDPNYCPQDCDFTPPHNVDPVTDFWQIPCPNCPSNPNFLALAWTNSNLPGDEDTAGTRIIIRTDDLFPDGPNSNSYTEGGTTYPVTDFPGTAGQDTEYYLFTGCNRSLIYHAMAYTYDTVNKNYSLGIKWDVTCSDQPVTLFPPP